ncbi:MAG: MarR family transcriptional regulator [Oculatellaceae cyanobacterium Prado106]|jgi:DNA-binding MarR family transcriptional regulator/CheY-like chemotaxis protein|nr:MarR family transcriptional regulator [Oculatellaceae cyanobacterium Prado106]
MSNPDIDPQATDQPDALLFSQDASKKTFQEISQEISQAVSQGASQEVTQEVTQDASQEVTQEVSQDTNQEDDDEIQFAEETETAAPLQSWKILIVDDDPEVHEVTRLALSDFTFEGKHLAFISAFSAQEAKQMLQHHPDIAVIFLDVVMETENAGLQVVQYVRQELENLPVRIILRTGQPGQAPEAVIAADYGIDDYKTKTELTAKKLFISVITALRTYSILMQMQELGRSLKAELLKSQHQEATLRLQERQEQAQTEQWERSLTSLYPHSPQPATPETPEHFAALSHLVSEMSQDRHASGGGTWPTLSLITRMARTVLKMTDEQSAKLGLSQSKLSILMYLQDEPELCASPSALAKHCGVSRAAMTGLLDGLEQEEYVERDSHPSDRRALMVKLTEKGKAFLDWMPLQNQYQITQLLETLDETNRQEFIELATKVLRVLENQ